MVFEFIEEFLLFVYKIILLNNMKIEKLLLNKQQVHDLLSTPCSNTKTMFKPKSLKHHKISTSQQRSSNENTLKHGNFLSARSPYFLLYICKFDEPTEETNIRIWIVFITGWQPTHAPVFSKAAVLNSPLLFSILGHFVTDTRSLR